MLLLLVVACSAPVPPAPPAPLVATPVKAPFAKTWDAVIDVFAARNIPIKTIDRASGFIATDQLSAATAQRFADCGSMMGGYGIPPQYATYNARVKGDSASSTIQITVQWTTGIGPYQTCSTRGIWENEAASEIKRIAEGR